MNTNPAKAIAGAITIRRKLKISGLNSVSVEPGPVIKAKPMTRQERDGREYNSAF